MKILLPTIFFFLIAVQDDFTFTSRNQKVVLRIDNGNKTLVWGKKSILNIKVENIDTQKMSMSAPGIRFVKSNNPKEEINLEIMPEKDVIENDTLNLFIGFKDKNNEYIDHRFAIFITN